MGAGCLTLPLKASSGSNSVRSARLLSALRRHPRPATGGGAIWGGWWAWVRCQAGNRCGLVPRLTGAVSCPARPTGSPSGHPECHGATSGQRGPKRMGWPLGSHTHLSQRGPVYTPRKADAPTALTRPVHRLPLVLKRFLNVRTADT